MTEQETRLAIVAEARTWIGTPYISNGCVKGAGVDCGMLLLAVYHAVGLIPFDDPRPYPAQWALHQRSELFLGMVEKWGKEVPVALPGDVALFQFGHCWAHGSIVIEWPRLIHANPSNNSKAACREDDAIRNSDLMGKKPRFFSYWSPV